ncbi:MAG: low temperature requirement protein A [Chloroflexota bacterium]|jgi:low temperature requirement protein LtrA|nr:low temperature requirement protein A [Chloroflexota bacterium]MDH5242845.1 low temperature requirement protein A [Chloroflexota bacterium]
MPTPPSPIVPLPAPERRGIRAESPQAVTFVELFFDLVFVFAITQLTVLTAHDLTPGGILRSILLGWLIWWAWTQFTWTLNPADTTHPAVRVVTLTATGVALVMAASVPRAFAEDALWFAVPYVVVRVIGLGLQVRVDLEREDTGAGATGHGGVVRWATLSMVGLVFVLIGSVVDPSIRPAVWLLAIVADLVAAAIAARRTVWDLNPAHLSERHGLFVIIAIGESLIVAGTAVANDERTTALAVAAVGAILGACLLWWTYFGWLKDALEHGIAAAAPERLGPLARDAFSLAHFPLIGGIVGFAVAIEEIVAHPEAPAPAEVVAALGIGVTLFVACSALSLRLLGGPVLMPRLAILAAMLVGLVVVTSMPPAWPLGVVAAALLAIVLVEGGGARVRVVASGSPRDVADPDVAEQATA